MCDLICGIITCCVLSCDIGTINASGKIMFKNQKHRENMEIKDIFFYINLHVKDHSDIEITAC